MMESIQPSKASRQLMEEHTGVLLMLKILDAIRHRLEMDLEVPTEQLEDILEFFQVFVDKCHHGKEEDYLFPALEESDPAREGGPLGILLTQHALGRTLVRGMKEGIGEYRQSGGTISNKFRENAGRYIELLTRHIRQEDQMIFPLADRTLSPEKLEQLFNDYEKLEEERIGAGRHEEFHKLLRRLKTSYL